MLARDNVFWASHFSRQFYYLPQLPVSVPPVPNLMILTQLSFRQRSDGYLFEFTMTVDMVFQKLTPCAASVVKKHVFLVGEIKQCFFLFFFVFFVCLKKKTFFLKFHEILNIRKQLTM